MATARFVFRPARHGTAVTARNSVFCLFAGVPVAQFGPCRRTLLVEVRDVLLRRRPKKHAPA
ncbi:hypothetical protein KEK_05507 [Mycolicibacterium thermoresistibile ATCC 19527]|uniref:Uncharacterized protein n=1 Tax=Mycolicibacterium thermoresistibile (strain ATCC 19527 / DSM 44167 / CIP 105390 / JCM 6362 / NCTC 10409 / 316) TaxID=1078020 RepID=G7CDP9_MYCT3|nr:hypothetical protein KEK_05507 [Mycolicibacterium thermoresistibile ATCC 19527]